MRYTFARKNFPASNPVANALVIIAGALVIGVSVVLGFFAFVALSAVILAAAAVIGARVWWLKRKLGRQLHAGHGRERHGQPGGVIEGEFQVVDKDGNEE